MTVTQGIQRLQFSLECRTSHVGTDKEAAARRVVASIAAESCADDPVEATREVLDALGLLP